MGVWRRRGKPDGLWLWSSATIPVWSGYDQYYSQMHYAYVRTLHPTRKRMSEGKHETCLPRMHARLLWHLWWVVSATDRAVRHGTMYTLCWLLALRTSPTIRRVLDLVVLRK